MSTGPIRSGSLNRKIAIEQRDTSKDSYGQRVNAWTVFCTTRASISPMSGRELESAQAINAEVTHELVIRHRPGVNASMRVRYQNRIFNILSAMDQDTQHRKLSLMCSEGLNQG